MKTISVFSFLVALSFLFVGIPLGWGQDFYLGSNTPNSTYTLSSGTNAYVNGFIGADANATNNELTISSGAEFQFNGYWPDGILRVGQFGSENSVRVESSGKLTVWDLVLGEQASSSNNILEVSGISSTVAAHTIYIGGSGGLNAAYVTDSGVISAYDVFVGTFSQGNALLVNGANSTVTTANRFIVGYGAGAEGTVTIANNGTLNANEIQLANSEGTHAILNVGSYNGNDSAGAINASSISIGSEGGALNFNQTNSLVITCSITGVGAINQLGSGTTTLWGDSASSYSGALNVSGGVLLMNGVFNSTNAIVSNNAAIGGLGTLNGDLFFDSGAKFLFSLTNTLTVNEGSVAFGGFSINDLINFDDTVPLGTYTLIDGTAVINTLNLSNLGSENATSIGGGKSAYFESGSFQVVVLPEPSTCALLIFSGAAFLWALKRRKS